MIIRKLRNGCTGSDAMRYSKAARFSFRKNPVDSWPQYRPQHRTTLSHGDSPARAKVTLIDSADFRLGYAPSSSEEVQVWRIDLDAVASATAHWQSLLSQDEKDRAARFHFDRDRLYFSAARGLLRTVLGAYLAIEPHKVRFHYSDKGKPELADPYASSRLTFNLSHSGGAALIGLTRERAIGVDIEKIRDDFDTAAIARRFFSAKEQEQLARLPAEMRHRAFFRCWTLKEAFIKALGEGLSHPLHQFDVFLDDQVLLVTRPDPAEAERWLLERVDAGPAHAAAVAVLRPTIRK